eukprot:UN0243
MKFMKLADMFTKFREDDGCLIVLRCHLSNWSCLLKTLQPNGRLSSIYLGHRKACPAASGQQLLGTSTALARRRLPRHCLALFEPGLLPNDIASNPFANPQQPIFLGPSGVVCGYAAAVNALRLKYLLPGMDCTAGMWPSPALLPRGRRELHVLRSRPARRVVHLVELGRPRVRQVDRRRLCEVSRYATTSHLMQMAMRVSKSTGLDDNTLSRLVSKCSTSTIATPKRSCTRLPLVERLRRSCAMAAMKARMINIEVHRQGNPPVRLTQLMRIPLPRGV